MLHHGSGRPRPRRRITAPRDEFAISLRHTALVAALLPLFFGACGAGSSGETGAISETADSTIDLEQSAVPDDIDTSRAPETDTTWTFSVSNAGAALSLRGAEDEVLRIACGRSPHILTVDVPGFSSIASEERLSFGVDGEPFVFVAQVTPPPPSGVHAEREPDEEFLELFVAARMVSAVYGSQTTGPHMAPDSADAALFVDACVQGGAS